MVMVLWIGVDDTDSLHGMCTTFLATEIIRELCPAYDVIGYPRLVRLNPNIPWKTRGNGAICLRFGTGSGAPRAIGSICGQEVRSFSGHRGKEGPEVLDDISHRLESLLETWARFEDPSTNPAFVVLRRKPPPSLYWRAVRGIVRKSEVLPVVRDRGLVRLYKNGRGVIGAAAGTAWRPRDRTYEVLAYRSPERWGTPRVVDVPSVVRLDERFPSTFNNYDPQNQHVVITPRSPCPVLMGIRGDDPFVLPSAMRTVGTEALDRWLVFETNQGTDDHVVRDDWRLRPFTSVSLEGTVRARARSVRGGHVFFPLEGPRRICVATYEPAKQFRRVVTALLPGDHVRVYGSIRARPRGLNLEKLEVLSVVPDRVKLANPRCTRCGKSMKSIGQGAGYRCVRRHEFAPGSAGVFGEIPRSLSLGWYEPPVSARRHLAMPLKRMAVVCPSVPLAGQ